VILGWTVVGEVIGRAHAVGAVSIGLLVASGLVYSLGAVVYAAKRPDPFPRVFGYHEVFHAMVVVASVCLFGHVLTLVRAF
jgi:hemolysin III